MKTLEEIQDEVANKFGYQDWQSIDWHSMSLRSESPDMKMHCINLVVDRFIEEIGNDLLKSRTEAYSPTIRMNVVEVHKIKEIFASAGIELTEEIPF